MASCNKCSVKRHDSPCHCMPLLASDPRPARLSRRPGNSGPTAQRHAGRGVWGCLPHERGHPGRPCRCCQLGEGLLVSVRARDQQVGLGCSCWREARDGDPTGQGSDRVCVGGSGGGVALGFSPAALWEEVNKRKYLWGEWGHDQGVGSGAVLPAAATGASQALHIPLR